ncbi:MAG: replicative DNA helicase [Metamycoplasmataceae bacterium]
MSIFYDLNIEKSLLGLIIKNDNCLRKAIVYLDYEDFYDEKNKLTFKFIKEFVINDEKLDIELLIESIRKKDTANVLTGGKYLYSLVKDSGYVSSFDNYLKIISESSNLRKMKEILTTSINELNKKTDNSYEELSATIQNRILEIENGKNINKDFVKISSIIEEYIKKIEQLEHGPTDRGLLTGFSQLDEITSGLQKGDLIIIAARPSMGKTAFALNIAINISKRKNVAFFSLEMPAEQLVSRIVSHFSNINTNKLRRVKNISNDDWTKLFYAKKTISDLNLFIDDSPSLKLEELIWKARRLKRSDKLDLIIIDYLQLIPVSSSNYGENRQQEVSKISRLLKQLARELEVPVIALSQLSRRVEQREDKTPLMSDLRESGAIEQDADIIAFIFREEYYNKNEENKNDLQETNIIISKHRNGPTGRIDLIFNPSLGQFSDKKE